MDMNDLDSSPAPLEGNETVPDLLSLVKQRIEDRLSARIDELGARVDALNARAPVTAPAPSAKGRVR